VIDSEGRQTWLVVLYVCKCVIETKGKQLGRINVDV